mmetsp:Transcript_11827/g.13165  ORF Transcript_11827/g.13165 Transcript_11827/m.13165 type:complete len:168 (+) Transcript_11827:244-747(+)
MMIQFHLKLAFLIFASPITAFQITVPRHFISSSITACRDNWTCRIKYNQPQTKLFNSMNDESREELLKYLKYRAELLGDDDDDFDIEDMDEDEIKKYYQENGIYNEEQLLNHLALLDRDGYDDAKELEEMMETQSVKPEQVHILAFNHWIQRGRVYTPLNMETIITF